MGFDVLQEWSRFLLVMVMISSKLHCVVLDMQCPSSSQWKFRADSYCSTNKSYLCLYDENTRQYKEFCQDEPSFDAAGYKIVLVGGLHGIPCEDKRYQPIKYWTNGSSVCAFQKSKCNGEGAVIVQDGTAKSDRTCRCDYTKGYDFVIKPKNTCFCLSTDEDCSCYLTHCQNGFLLTPDYECVSTTTWKADFVCPFIKDDRFSEQHEMIPRVESLQNSTATTRVIVSVMLIVMIIIISISTVLLCCVHNRNIEEQEYQKKEKEKWKVVLDKFLETTASRLIEKRLQNCQCVIITGPFGCGKSSIAFWTAFQLEQKGGYDVIILLKPEDILKYASSRSKQLFVIDDIFGKYSRIENDIAWWNEHNKSISDILSRTNNIRLLMTCRSTIYRSVMSGLNTFPYVELSLISNSLQLSLDERRSICQLYLTQNICTLLTDNVLLMYNFLPSLCVNFLQDKQQSDFVKYFKIPHEIVSLEIKRLKRSDLAYLVLALLVIKDDNVEKNMFADEIRNDDQLLTDLSQELGHKVSPPKRLILEMCNVLNDTYLKSNESAFMCIEKNLFDIIAYEVGGVIVGSLIKYGSSNFLKERVFLKSYLVKNSDLFIEIPLNLAQQYFTRMMSDLNKGTLWEVLDSKQSTVLDFRKHLKALALKNIEKLSAVDSEDSTALHVASARGYSEYIELFVALDISKINQEDNKGQTPLHLACENGHVRATSLLIKYGASLNNTDSNEMTPLDIACSKGYVEIVNLLVSKSAAVKQRSSDKRTALHVACTNGNEKIATLLLRGNAFVNVADNKGYTPLHLAAIKGNIEIVKLLIQHKANIDYTDNSGKTPLVHAREKSRTEVVNLLMKHKPPGNSNDY